MKKNKKDDERLENFFEVFIRNYKNVPGFRSLIKLSLYVIFIAIFIIVVLANSNNITDNDNHYNDKSMISTTAKVVKNITYKEILENVIKENKDVYAEIQINGEKYVVDAIVNNEDISGYYETSKLTKRFKIVNNQVYELNLDKEMENDKLFKEINLDFVIPSNLISTLKSNISIKSINDNETIYRYNLEINNNDYDIEVFVKENILTHIEINSENEQYYIIYE